MKKFQIILIALMVFCFIPACSSNKSTDDAVPVAAGPESTAMDQSTAMPAPPVEEPAAPKAKKTKKVKVKKEVMNKDYEK